MSPTDVFLFAAIFTLALVSLTCSVSITRKFVDGGEIIDAVCATLFGIFCGLSVRGLIVVTHKLLTELAANAT